MFIEKLKKTFSRSSMKNVGKMFIFNYVQIKNSILFWVFWALFLVCQPILSIVFYSVARNNMLDYSLIIILVPLIFGFIFITILIYLLFQDNKTNSVEFKIICSKFTRSQVLLSRILLIWITLFANLIAQDIFLLMYPIVDVNKLGTALFISNTFITPFIMMLYSLILIFLSYKFNKVTFLVLSSVICVLTLGLSLITRPFINTESNMKYNVNNPSYFVKLTDENTDIILAETNNILVDGELHRIQPETIIEQMNYLL